LPDATGDNTDGTTNFIPKMNFEVLINGYKQILHTIYTPKNYYERVKIFLNEYKPNKKLRPKVNLNDIGALFKSVFVLGVKDKFRVYYWKLFISTLVKYPRRFGLAINLAVKGYHFRKVYEKIKDIEVDEALLARQREVLNGEPT